MPSEVAVDSRWTIEARPWDDPAGADLRRLDAGTAEVKRMYVVPEMRGTGVAADLLRALESAAAGQGLHVLRLETGTEQPDAQRFYRREGYREIPLFGTYVGSELSVCFERDLR